MSKIKEYREKHPNLFLGWCFGVPTLIMALLYAVLQVYPIGENSVLILDLNAQYVYFFEYLSDVLHGEASLLYSWRRALGGEFMGMFAYYLASPLSFIVALFPKEHITEALLVMFLLKTGLCGLTSGYYLHKNYPSNKISVIVFSTLYALSSYAIVMQHNTMWTDALILLPLVMLGVESLIKDGKYKLFVISLSVTVLANYYIGYMVCIFVFLYFFYYLITHPYDGSLGDERLHGLKSLLRIGVFSLIALAIAAVILLPAYYSLSFGKSTFSNPNYEFTQKFDFLDLLSKLYIGSYDTVRPAGLPFIYCGMLTAMMLPFYFLTKKIPVKEKITGAVLLAIFVISFNASTIDLFWHGLQRPNWLNYRYSFIFIFLLIVFAYRAFTFIREIDYRHILASGGVLLLLLFIIQKQGYEYIDDLKSVWVSVGFIGLYMAVLYAYKNRPFGKHIGAGLLAAVVLTETFCAGIINMTDLDKDVIYSNRTGYQTFMDKMRPAVDAVTEGDDSFFRMEKATHRKTNDNMALDINGITSSTSTLNASVIELLSSMGYRARSHWAKYQGGNPVGDSLLGFKYLILDEKNGFGLYDCVYQDPANALYGYHNPYALSVAFASDNDILALNTTAYQSPFQVLNAMVTALLGEEETVQVFKPLEVTGTDTYGVDIANVTGHKRYTKSAGASSSTVTYSFTAPDFDSHLFFFIPSTWQREVRISVNGADHGKYFENDRYNITYFGEYEADSAITFSLALQKDDLYVSTQAPFFWALDQALFEEVMTKLQAGNFIIEEHSDTELVGKVTVAEGQTTLFTTIPYDEGWHIYIDGMEHMPVRTLGSLISVPITPGEHTVRMIYMPDCFVQGAAISVGGTAAFLLVILFEVLLRKRRKGDGDDGDVEADLPLIPLGAGPTDDPETLDPLSEEQPPALPPIDTDRPGEAE